MIGKYNSDNHYVSPLNFHDEITAKINIPNKVYFSDCTLREGEQQPGVVLTKKDKIRIALKFDEIGLHQLELGMIAVSPEERETMKAIIDLGIKAKTIAICRTIREEVDMASDMGFWGVIISMPIGELQLKYKIKWSMEEIVEKVVDVTEYAKKQGLYVVLSPYDTTRADMEKLESFLEQTCKTGYVNRVRLVDTTGSASPEAIAYLTRKIISITSLPVEAHCHNDFGLATANTLSAITAGAQFPSTTFHGMGERAGGASTEEVAMSLLMLYGKDTGLDYRKFYSVSKLVEKLTGIKQYSQKPIVGDNIFDQEAGLIVGGYLKCPFTAVPYLPEYVGQKSRILLGKKSGKATIEMLLDKYELHASEEQVGELLRKVKRISQEEKSTISENRFKDLAYSLIEK